MNLRLKLLSVTVLGVFAAFALGYYKYYVAPKPPGVILFIVPGLNTDHIARTQNTRLNLLTRSARFAVVNNHDLSVPPFQNRPHTLATYYAAGCRTTPDRLGLSADGRVQDNLLYIAQRAGRTVGLVGTGSPAAAELAAFYAHSTDPGNPADVLPQLFDNTKVNVILSGGADDFATVRHATQRDLLHEARQHGYRIARTSGELQAVPVRHLPVLRATRVLGLFPENGPRPSLTDLTRRAIQFLEHNLGGYFLVIHDSLVADAIRGGNPAQITAEIEQLDRALASARKLAGRDSVIILYSPANTPPASQSFGWLAVYTSGETMPKGFITAKDLFRYLRRQLDWKQF